MNSSFYSCPKFFIHHVSHSAWWLLVLMLVQQPLNAEGNKYCLIKTTEINKENIIKNYMKKKEGRDRVDKEGWHIHFEGGTGRFGESYSNDYIVSPDESIQKTLPMLTETSCSFMERIIGFCTRSRPEFYESAKIYLLQGYTLSYFGGQELKLFAIYGGKTIELPSELSPVGSGLKGDVVLEGSDGELVLYNGSRMASVLINEPYDKTYDKWKWWIEFERLTDRVFIFPYPRSGHKRSYAYEIMSGPSLRKIEINPKIPNLGKFVSDIKTKQIWMIGDEGIYALAGKVLKRVVHFSDGSSVWPHCVGHSSAGELVFAVSQNYSYNSPYQTYLLKQSDTNCHLEIDFDKDQLLLP